MKRGLVALSQMSTNMLEASNEAHYWAEQRSMAETIVAGRDIEKVIGSSTSDYSQQTIVLLGDLVRQTQKEGYDPHNSEMVVTKSSQQVGLRFVSTDEKRAIDEAHERQSTTYKQISNWQDRLDFLNEHGL
jgi:hypothetical protein